MKKKCCHSLHTSPLRPTAYLWQSPWGSDAQIFHDNQRYTLQRTENCFTVITKKKTRTRIHKGKLEMWAFCRTAELDQKSHNMRIQLIEKANTDSCSFLLALRATSAQHIFLNRCVSKIPDVCAEGINQRVPNRFKVNPGKAYTCWLKKMDPRYDFVMRLTLRFNPVHCKAKFDTSCEDRWTSNDFSQSCHSAETLLCVQQRHSENTDNEKAMWGRTLLE